jgi:hypothetical protein
VNRGVVHTVVYVEAPEAATILGTLGRLEEAIQRLQ